jgi:hypothetical protein
MIENTKQAVGLFLEAWAPELEKSVEMFTGTTVTIEPGETGKLESLLAPGDPVLWLQQKLEGEKAGTVWIGTPETTCIAMAGAVADDPGGRESLFKELLLQSFAGAAHLLSSGRDHKIVCGDSVENAAPPEAVGLHAVWLAGPGQERRPLLMGLDSDLLDLRTRTCRVGAKTARDRHCNRSVARFRIAGSGGIGSNQAPYQRLDQVDRGFTGGT